ncbi:MAG: hypothetical protein ACK5JH_04060 [Anaerocolumna sp.]
MNSSLIFGTTVRLKDTFKRLKYCKEHSSEETYTKVLKSVKKTGFLTAFVFIGVMGIYMSVLAILARPTDTDVSSNIISYSDSKIGHVYGDEFWYIDNEKYIVDIADYGYNINDYEWRTPFNVYLDENHNVVGIDPFVSVVYSVAIYWMIGGFVSYVIIMVIFAMWLKYRKSSLNPGREWFLCNKWLNAKDIEHEWYNG